MPFYYPNASDYAKRLLRHYFELIAKRSGIQLDHDCYVEIDSIVDAIIEATKEGREYNGK